MKNAVLALLRASRWILPMPNAVLFPSTQPLIASPVRRTSVSQKLHLFRTAAVLICGFLLLATYSFAQTVTGTIGGSVTDSTGQVIVGASVKLTNDATGEVRSAQTTGSGEFIFPVLQPGTYTVRVESQGFRAYERAGNV